MTEPRDTPDHPCEPCPTMMSLMALGFTERPPEYSDFKLGFKLASVELDAQEMVSLRMVPVVQVSGLLQTTRVLAMIDVELLRNLTTPEEAAAWLVFALRRHEKNIWPLPTWWSLGEASLHLHPVVRQRKAAADRAIAFAARPHCRLEDDHARLFRRHLLDAVSRLTEMTEAVVTFDGDVLKVDINGSVVRAVGHGKPWPVSLLWPLSGTMKLPSRFTRPQVQLGYFDGTLDFERYNYPARESPL